MLDIARRIFPSLHLGCLQGFPLINSAAENILGPHGLGPAGPSLSPGGCWCLSPQSLSNTCVRGCSEVSLPWASPGLLRCPSAQPARQAGLCGESNLCQRQRNSSWVGRLQKVTLTERLHFHVRGSQDLAPRRFATYSRLTARRCRLGEGKELAQGHTAEKWQSRDSNQESSWNVQTPGSEAALQSSAPCRISARGRKRTEDGPQVTCTM